jgi:hypothetical protein
MSRSNGHPRADGVQNRGPGDDESVLDVKRATHWNLDRGRRAAFASATTGTTSRSASRSAEHGEGDGHER